MKKRLRKKRHRGEFAPPVPLTGFQRVRRERLRQLTDEGYSEAHDDDHRDGSLERAADAYAQEPAQRVGMADAEHVPAGWPWEPRSWKPTPADRERELVKAGALYLAEGERLLRRTEHAPLVEWRARLMMAHYERVHAKLAGILTQLNARTLAQLLLPPAGAVLASLTTTGARQALRVLRGGRQRPLLYRWSPLDGGGWLLELLISEFPACLYDYQAEWHFGPAGHLVAYAGVQTYPPLPVQRFTPLSPAPTMDPEPQKPKLTTYASLKDKLVGAPGTPEREAFDTDSQAELHALARERSEQIAARLQELGTVGEFYLDLPGVLTTTVAPGFDETAKVDYLFRHPGGAVRLFDDNDAGHELVEQSGHVLEALLARVKSTERPEGYRGF